MRGWWRFSLNSSTTYDTVLEFRRVSTGELVAFSLIGEVGGVLAWGPYGCRAESSRLNLWSGTAFVLLEEVFRSQGRIKVLNAFPVR
mmetsp:Transcript_20753/g.67220  ORF Transcript_20753/g.67220 Transcript_20753/m.67220 type:complete len:87 (+) Transcript_20753:325-585(+)